MQPAFVPVSPRADYGDEEKFYCSHFGGAKVNMVASSGYDRNELKFLARQHLTHGERVQWTATGWEPSESELRRMAAGDQGFPKYVWNMRTPVLAQSSSGAGASSLSSAKMTFTRKGPISSSAARGFQQLQQHVPGRPPHGAPQRGELHSGFSHPETYHGKSGGSVDVQPEPVVVDGGVSVIAVMLNEQLAQLEHAYSQLQPKELQNGNHRNSMGKCKVAYTQLQKTVERFSQYGGTGPEEFSQIQMASTAASMRLCDLQSVLFYEDGRLKMGEYKMGQIVSMHNNNPGLPFACGEILSNHGDGLATLRIHLMDPAKYDEVVMQGLPIKAPTVYGSLKDPGATSWIVTVYTKNLVEINGYDRYNQVWDYRVGREECGRDSQGKAMSAQQPAFVRVSPTVGTFVYDRLIWLILLWRMLKGGFFSGVQFFRELKGAAFCLVAVMIAIFLIIAAMASQYLVLVMGFSQ